MESTDRDRLESRVAALERALTGEDRPLTDLADAATVTAELEALAERVETLEARVEEQEAALQALRGYVGNVRAVNREVERRADAALAAVEGRDGPAAGGENAQDRQRGRQRETAESTPTGSEPPGDGPGDGVESAASTRNRTVSGRAADGAGTQESGDGKLSDERGTEQAERLTETNYAGAADDGGGQGGDCPERARTEQFIERVRDVL